MKMRFIPYLLIVLFLGEGCVPVYQNLAVHSHWFPNKDMEEGQLYLLPSEDTVLAGNNKFLKKQVKEGVWLIPVKAKNNSNEPITLLKDKITIFNSYVETQTIEPEECFKKLKYSVSGRIAWGAAALATSVNFGTIGIFFNYKNPLLLIAAGSPFSAISAAKSNKQLKNDLDKFYLLDKSIAPGEIRYGIIGIHADHAGKIYIRVNN